MRVRVLATPGHTWTHLSYVLEDAATGEVAAVFTGGSLLHGSTGRPDLLGARHAPALAAAQHASARRLAAAAARAHAGVPDARLRQLLRGRARGRGTGAGIDDRRGGAGEPGADPGPRTVTSRRCWAAWMCIPAYYARMGPANTFGADAPALLPPPRVLRRPGAGPGRRR